MLDNSKFILNYEFRNQICKLKKPNLNSVSFDHRITPKASEPHKNSPQKVEGVRNLRK